MYKVEKIKKKPQVQDYIHLHIHVIVVRTTGHSWAK